MIRAGGAKVPPVFLTVTPAQAGARTIRKNEDHRYTMFTFPDPVRASALAGAPTG